MVVTAHDGTDELVTTGPTAIHDVRDGVVSARTFDPAEVGVDVVAPGSIAGGDAAQNAVIARRVFAGELGPYRDIVCLNAAAGLVVAGVVDDLGDGVARASGAIDSGAVEAVLTRLLEVA